MKMRLVCLLLTVALSLGCVSLRAQTDINLTGYTQTFDEEFNSLSVTASSPKGASTWYYWPPYGSAGAYSESTWDVAAFSVTSGILSDKAFTDGSGNWHSGNLSSMDPTGAGFGQQYGYFEIRCQMPSSGTGAWPAFWLMSQNSILNNNNGTSQPNIEIDVFEWYGTTFTNNQSVIQEASHNWLPTGGPDGLYDPGTPLPGGFFPWQGYHIYGCQVDPTNITWYVDGVQTNQIATPAGYITSPFYMMVDYALGGGWPLSGMVNNSSLNVDWVRVYSLPTYPQVTSATSASGTVGTAFSYQITGTNTPTSYNATGLPGGLTVNTSTGVISGSPTTAGTSSVTISATNSHGTGSATLSLTVGTPLPAPWQHQDVGTTGAAGTASYSGSTFTISGSGADIWGTADAFQYVYLTASGDCSITARVATQANTNASAKAAVMIRSDLTAGSAHAMLDVSPSGTEYIYRSSAGASAARPGSGSGTAPYWVRMTRVGSVFTGYTSPDGTTWTTISSETVTMGTSVYVGMPVCSHVAGTLGTATFDNITVTGASAPATPTGLTATAGNTQNVLSWAASTGATSYNIYRGTTAGGERATAIATGVTATSYTNTGLINGTTYYYKVTAVNSSGMSGYSNEASATPAGAPAAPTSLSATAGNAQNILAWTASSGATSYNVYRGTTAGGESATAIATSITSTSYTNTGLTNGTTYYYKVAAVNSSGTSGYSNEASATPVAGSSLPSPWLHQDIGSTGVTGSASYASGTFTVSGGGADVWGTADAFQYVYQPVSGDCSITARVATQTNTDPSAKAAVMIRSDLTAGSAHAMLDASPSGNIEFIYRTTAGGSAARTATTGTVPVWLRMTRVGNLFTSYVSTNGTTWTTVGSQTITMGTSVYIGLPVCSHVAGTLGTATFDNVAASTAALPSPWLNQDVGTPGVTGTASYASGVFTVSGGGADIWGSADAFQYVYQAASGDCSITARVASQTNTDPNAKAAVMIRSDLTAGSAHAMLDASPVGNVEFIYRTTAGGSAARTATTGTVPVWLRVTRVGSVFTGYVSTDGTTWTTVGSQTITMGTAVYIGMPVCSHVAGTLGTATFDNVTAVP